MAIPLPELTEEIEARLETMGFELVEGGWVGSPGRPILRIRVDVPDSMPGQGGVSVGQCAEISRALEPWLDEHPGIPERYVLEVSSPGVERPLVKERDWIRFTGHLVRIKAKGLPAELGNRIEGENQGVEEGSEGGLGAAILLNSGERVVIPFEGIKKAHLIYRWE